MKLLLIPFFVTALSCGMVEAKVIHVPSDQSTIQAGIDASADGDTVLVADGTYEGAENQNIVFHEKAILVTSENGPQNCIVDCQHANLSVGFLFNDPGDTSCTVRGFTIRNAGFGMCVWANSSPTILGNVIDSCNVGIWVEQLTTPLILGNSIQHSEYDPTWGSTDNPTGCGILVEFSAPEIRENTISANECCGIRVSRGYPDAKIIGNEIRGNESENGSTVMIGTYDSYARPDECVISELRSGGGICVLDGSSATIENNVFLDNASLHAGAIYCDSTSNVRILNNHIISNVSKIGGAIYTCSSATVIRNNIVSFTKDAEGSSRLERWYYNDLFMRYNYDGGKLTSVTYYYGFINNGGPGEARIEGQNVDTSFSVESGERCWMQANSFVDQYGNGGGISLTVSLGSDSLKLKVARADPDNPGMTHGCIALTMRDLRSFGPGESGNYGAGIIAAGCSSSPDVGYNDIYGNAGVNYLEGNTGESLSEVNLTGVEGNIFRDPLLLPPHLFLSASSPCVDAGDPDPAFDDRNQPPGMGTVRCDIGAYGGPENDSVAVISTSVKDHTAVPSRYLLYQNYPNPFNPTTTIEYSLPKAAFVVLRVYDILGRLVTTLVNSEKEPGLHKATFDGTGLSSGVYFYRLSARPLSGETGSYTAVKKLLLVK